MTEVIFLEFIRNYGAPIGFFTDNAAQQVSEIVKDLYRMYSIKDKQCEPHYQHQNPVERVIQELKRTALEIGKRVGVPPKYMVLLIMFTAELISRMANKDGKIPMQLLTGQPVDVSVYMDYHFWQLVITEDGDGKEILGRWCGPAYTQGDVLTYQILCQESGMLITRSNVRPAKNPMFPNRYIDKPNEQPIIQIGSEDSDDFEPLFQPEDLIGMTFNYQLEDKEVTAKVVSKIIEQNEGLCEQVKFLLKIGDDEYDRILSYNEVCNLMEEQRAIVEEEDPAPEEVKYDLEQILKHEGPLKPTDDGYKGCRWNVLVKWSTGEETWEPLNIIAQDTPVTCASYAKHHALLNTPGWKRLKSHVLQMRRLNVLIEKAKAKAKSKKNLGDPNYCRMKYGIRVPRNYKEAMMLDKLNGNRKWGDAVDKEMSKIKSYKTATSLGKGAKTPEGYHRITVHMVFDVKSSGVHKVRLVAAGNQAP